MNPNLVEPGFKYYISEVLNNCKNLKNKYFNLAYNVSLLALFILVFSIILSYKYKGRPSQEEVEIKERKKYEYILSKLKTLETTKMKKSQNLITNIPLWEANTTLIY